MGLTLREFAIGQSYKKGDYVFSTTESGVSTMYIAKSNEFVAAAEPKTTVQTGFHSMFPEVQQVVMERQDRLVWLDVMVPLGNEARQA